MRLLILSLGLIVGLFATASSAQVIMDQDVAGWGVSNTDPLYEDPAPTSVEPFDIDAAIIALAEEFCDVGEDTAGSLDSCPSTPEFDIRQILTDARAWTMGKLLMSQAYTMATTARIEELRLQLIEIELRTELETKQMELGIVYSADDVADLAAEAEGYWQRILELEDELGQLQDEAAEHCRRTSENDVEDTVCSEPAHQRALERL